jgi:hypothetical protein
MSDLRQSNRNGKPTFVESRRGARTKNNAPATMLGPSPSSFLENFHRGALWKGSRLFFRGRVVASIVPDKQWPGMWRVQLPDGHLSDVVNRSRAKDAALALVYAANTDGASRTFRKRRGSRTNRPLALTARSRKVRI